MGHDKRRGDGNGDTSKTLKILTHHWSQIWLRLIVVWAPLVLTIVFVLIIFGGNRRQSLLRSFIRLVITRDDGSVCHTDTEGQIKPNQAFAASPVIRLGE